MRKGKSDRSPGWSRQPNRAWRVGWLVGLALLAGVHALTALADAERLAEGKRLATARKKGNCLACHAFDGGELPGNIGPPLMSMKQRYPERSSLRAQIWDAGQRNPGTVMPPFGRHRVLSEAEIDLIVDYIHTL